MAYPSSLVSLGLALGLLVFAHGCLGRTSTGSQPGVIGSRQRHPLKFRDECRLENLNVLEPSRRIEAEAGFTELWDENENELVCAGSSFIRHVIRRNGLLLPGYTNQPELFYVVQGRGLQGVVFPGCPETFQTDESQYRVRESQRFSQSESQSEGDQHQKVRQIREGDVVALPAGVSHWIYNQGQSDLVLVSILFTSQEQNQLDENIRKFFLAGNPQKGFSGERRRHSGESSRRGQHTENFGNIFQGFADELLSEAYDVDNELVRRLKAEDDQRGHIVEVRDKLRVLGPQFEEGSQWEERERESERESERRWEHSRDTGRRNGVEETFCTMRLRENIDNPARADYYNPRGGRITSLNSFSLPILSYLELSAERGVLYKDAVVAPHYYMNSHALIYITRGSARVQIVGELGRNVFDGEVREKQLLVVPQSFAVIKKAGSEGFEWISFRTNENAMIAPLAGRTSVIRALPEDVLVNAFGISRQEARSLKINQEEVSVLSPGSRSRSEQGRRD